MSRFNTSIHTDAIPLAYLDAITANQILTETYVTMACLGALAWDILSNTPKDYILVTNYKLKLPTVVYFLSRVAAMSLILTSVAYLIAPVDSCSALLQIIGWSNVASLSTSSFLFFLRIKALFDRQRMVVLVFFVLWFGNAGTSIVTPFSFSGEHIPGSKICWNTAVRSFCSATFIFSAIFDTSVFMAVFWKFYYLNPRPVNPGVMGSFNRFFGLDLPTLSRAFLQGGQIYYLITVTTNIAVMIAMLSPVFSAPQRPSFAIPKVTIDNMMACIVFRNLKLGYYMEGIDSLNSVSAPEFGTTTHEDKSFSLQWKRESANTGLRRNQDSVLELSPVRLDRSFAHKCAEVNVIMEHDVKGDSISEPCDSVDKVAV